jgi:hypothetical protein
MIGTAMAPSPRIRATVSIVALAGLAAACTSGSGIQPVTEPFIQDSSAPLGAPASRVDDASSAGLAFVPLELDRPKAASEWILPDHGEPDRTAAAFVYSSPAWGDVVVTEWLTTETQDDLISELSPCDGCLPPPERVDVSGGVVSFVSSDAYRTWISWNVPAAPSRNGGLANDLRLNVIVTGPPERFSRQEAIDLATELTRPS